MPDAVFLDVRLPDGNGLDLLPELDGLPSSPEVIIITGLGDPDGAELAMINGAWDYIEKTASTKKITLTLDRALQYRSERKSAVAAVPVKALVRERIIGNSAKVKACLDMVARSPGRPVGRERCQCAGHRGDRDRERTFCTGHP